MALHEMCLSEQLRCIAYATVCYVLLFSGASTINWNMFGEINPCCYVRLDVGENLWLNCTVTNESVLDVDNVVLTFRRGQAETEVEQQYLHYDGRSTVILNYTTQKYDRYITTYTCKAGNTVIGPAVTVRLPMRPVAPDNLTCVVNEQQTYMACWWSHAELYGSSMTLNVTYHKQFRTNEVIHTTIADVPCPEMTQTSCRWSSPAVFPSQGVLYIVTLTATLSRSDETDRVTFEIDPQENVVCDRVLNFRVLQVNSTCAQLVWDAPAETAVSGTYNKTFQLSLWQQHLPGHVLTKYLAGKVSVVEVCGLLPGTAHTTNVTCRVLDHLPWGEASTLQFTTDLDYLAPPTSCAGCYYQSTDRDFVVFWQPPQADIAYWPLTGYVIRTFDTTNGSWSHVKADGDATSAASSLNDRHNYTVTIYSRYGKGMSTTFAKVILPAKSKRPAGIDDMHAEKTSSGDVTMRWRIPGPSQAFPRVNVTVVWCPALPQACTCKGPVQWRDVGDASAGSATLPHTQSVDLSTTLFGLTVVGTWGQDLHVASGISWAKCHRPQILTEPRTSIYDYWYCLLIAVIVVMVLIAFGIYRQRRHLCQSRRPIGSSLEMQMLRGNNSSSSRYSESDISRVLDRAEETARKEPCSRC